MEVGPSLEVSHTLEALQMAIDEAKEADLTGLIHHSDKGIQYCCPRHVSKLKEHKIQTSMTQDSNPADNAITERINRVLKGEWLYRMPLPRDAEQAREHLREIIEFYNHKRPYLSNDRMTPQRAHSEHGGLRKTWKKQNIPKAL